MNREQAREKIKQDICAEDYLKPAPNHSAHNHAGYCCPYCGSGTHGAGSTGAVKYYPATNTWHCHACDRGGDVIDAYSLYNGGDYNEALTYLAAQIGVIINDHEEGAGRPTERPQNDKPQQKDKQPDQQINPAQIVDFTAYYKLCSYRLPEQAAIDYLEARGISLNTAVNCGLGFDPQADPAAAPGAMADEYKAHPTPRIIAPCTDSFYIARSIDPNTPAAYKAPNPKGTHTQIFNTAALYSGAGVVFVCEGIFDALSFIEAGHAAIATNGKGNGKLLLQQLEGRPTKAAIVIVPDNDPDPKTAEQAAELNRQLQALNVKSIVYNIAGSYHDANDALTHDRAAFEQNIAAAMQEISRDDLTDFLEKIQTEAYKAKQTGLRFFDDLLGGGILPQSLLLLLAAPAAGKTTLCAQIAERMAEQGEPFIYFNLEMSREQMLAKAISTKLYRKGYSQTTKQILQGYSWTDKDRQQITQAVNEYRRDIYPYLKYNPGNIGSNLEDILQYIDRAGKEAQAEGKPAPAIVIDYLHKLTSSDRTIKGEPGEIVKKAVDGLKQYAIKYNTFVITIAAVNRESIKAGKIQIHSGRDSSGIEFEGDYILTLNYRDVDSGKVNVNDNDEMERLQTAERRDMILRLAKGRFDKQGSKALVMFDAEHNTFYGTCDDFIPIENAPAFDDDRPQATMII